MSKILEQTVFVLGRKTLRGLTYSSISQVIHKPSEKVFSLKLNDGVGTVQYQKEGNIYNLMHTLVPDAYQGKGVGSHIAKEVLNYCQHNNIPVRITCSFLIKYIEKHPEYKSIVVDSEKKN